MEIRSRKTTAEDLAGVDRPDTLGTHTWWLIQNNTVGSRQLVVNTAELPSGTAHQLHRHPNAEQAVIVISGRGLHLRLDDDPVTVEEGDFIHVPAGEWHGFANPYGEPVRIASVYGGVGSREEAGYDLYPGSPFDADSFGRRS